MRWLEKITNGRYRRMNFGSAKMATATRAVIADQDRTGFPHIEVSITLEHGKVDPRTKNEIDEVRFYLPLEVASRLCQQMISSIEAATPRLPGRSYNIPFE